MDRKQKQRLIPYALQQKLPELVLKNAGVVDVFSKRVRKADVAIQDGVIVGVGDCRGREERDLGGAFVAPGFIDSHVHIESSMVSPPLFAEKILAHGTTAVVADPHEIVNVAGGAGMEYMLSQTENAGVRFYFMLPSCVPISSIEHNGAAFGADRMKKFRGHPRVLGLGEVMDCPGVLRGDGGLLEKIELMEGGVIDGHAPAVRGRELQAYRLAGVQTDHECTDYAQALERIEDGFIVQVREGSAARNLDAILSGALKDGLDCDRFVFCTDDLHLDDVVHKGHIDHILRRAAALGMDPVQAVRCATLNAAQLYGLSGLGAVAPGYRADLVVLDNLRDFGVLQVFLDGKAWDGTVARPAALPDARLTESVHVPPLSADRLACRCGKKFPVIQVIPGEILTKRVDMPLPGEGGVFVPGDDLLKVAVVQRHDSSGRLAVGAVKGFGLKNGAVASTVAHDSHNLIAIGDNDRDILCAVGELRRCQGGYTVCSGGRVLETLPLPVAGLFTDDASLDVAGRQKEISGLCHRMGVPENIDPFQNLSFLSLTVIPEIRITDSGIFDVLKNKFL